MDQGSPRSQCAPSLSPSASTTPNRNKKSALCPFYLCVSSTVRVCAFGLAFLQGTVTSFPHLVPPLISSITSFGLPPPRLFSLAKKPVTCRMMGTGVSETGV
jgi:hypothetical protein